MAYNTKPIVKDVDGNPISQYYNPDTDSYEPVEGSHGANKVMVENNDLSLIPILDKLSQLTGTVIDEETRKSNELQRIDNEDTRQSNENIRNTNEIERIENENIRIENENTRIENENIRKANEQNRVELYNDLINKVNSGYFDGKNLEFHWRGTELGVRVEGETEYIYVDLKGETGNIDNLTRQHIETALGYTPVKSVNNVLPDETGNVELDIDTSEIENRIGNVENDLVAHEADKANPHNVTKAQVGLGNVDNKQQVPLEDFLAGMYPVSMVNLLPDSGRFADETYSPTSIFVGGFRNDSGFFASYNGTSSFRSAGKFIHNNTTYGGVAGELTQDMIDLLSALESKGGRHIKRHGTEFYIAEATMGTGTFHGHKDKYLFSTTNNPILGNYANLSFWVRLKSGGSIYVVRGLELYRDGIKQNTTETEITPSDGWVHIRCIHRNVVGYSTTLFPLFANSGDVVQIALPVVTNGILGTFMHTAPIPCAAVTSGILWHSGNSGPFYRGSGSPEGVVTAPVGSIYQRTNGGAGTTFYVKESGTGNTGWVAK